MAVVKNLMVRVGADLSGLVSGFSKGSKAMGGFSKNAKKEAQVSAAALGNLKKAMAQGGKNKEIVSLVDQIAEVEAGLKAAGEAGFGWGFESFENDVRLLRDLKTQLNEYVDKFNQEPDGPKQWVAQLREMGHQSQQLDSFVAKLQASVDASQPLGAQLKAAKSALKEMEAADLGMGDAAWDDMYQTVSRLTQEAKEYKNSLDGVGKETDQVRKKTSRIGNAAKAAGSGFKRLVSKIGSIGSRARSSTGGVEKLLRSIRRIGIVSLGLRFVKSIFGELSSVVHEYIAENATLKAQTDALKSSMGQALAPAINLVVRALSALMPYIIGVSNAIGQLINNLFGSGWTNVVNGARAATVATNGAASAQKEYNRTLAGFDEITKLSEKTSGGGGGGSASIGSTIQMQGKLPAWLTNFASSIKEAIRQGDFFGVGEAIAEGLGSAVDSARAFLNGDSFKNKISGLTSGVTSTINGFFSEITASEDGKASIASNIGGLIGDGIALAVSTIHQFVTGVKWGDVGKAIAQAINGAVESLTDSDISIGETIGDLINGAVTGLTELIAEIDWGKLADTFVDGVVDVIVSINWDDVIKLLGTASKALGDVLWSFLFYKSNTTEAIVGSLSKQMAAEAKAMGYSGGGTNVLEAAQSAMTLPLDVVANIVGVNNKYGPHKEIAIKAVAAIVSFQDKLKNKKMDFQAFLTRWKDSLPSKNLTGFIAKLTSWKDSLPNKKIGGFLANLGSWKENFSHKNITGFMAKLTSWKDTLSNKIVDFKANMQKGWSGPLAKVLGIETITTKLNILSPKIEIDWGETKVGGAAFKFPKGFKIKWNARGGIMNSAAIFGGYGNTLFGGGEAGREAILPLDRNTGWMDKIADRIVQRIVSAPGGEQNITIQLVLDGKIITQTVVRNVNAQARATGIHPMGAFI